MSTEPVESPPSSIPAESVGAAPAAASPATRDLRALFDLAPHGPDVYVGEGLRYAWGGLYGGHIVAQALRAAAHTVDAALLPHSLRAYFIRRGDNSEPVRYEVDRIRNGRSFATRRVVARQSIGAILNLEASFQLAEEAADIATVSTPAGLPSPESLPGTSWSEFFDRRFIPEEALPELAGAGAGRIGAWMKVTSDLGDDQLLQRCGLAYVSDDLPTDSVVHAHPQVRALSESGVRLFHASLDHTMWFHRPMRADAWHLHVVACHGFVSGRGLTIGHVFAEDGTHVATLAQEVLTRIPQ